MFIFEALEAGGSVENTDLPLKADDIERMDEPYQKLDNTEERQLIPEEKQLIREETEWSDSIIDGISSMKEYQIYKEAELVEAKVGEKTCLLRPDIDMEQRDGFGHSNCERMKQGLAPLTPEGRPYELHHIGQHQDSPLAELTMQEHRGQGNDTILHVKTIESEIDREKFGHERAEHWQNRAGVIKDE
ncbi:MAG: HNH/ENDO VII family nuclease [Eubacteriales bacterium]|nr:HNH/ENDO VII family nuclease [Eubacteriales bacterium]